MDCEHCKNKFSSLSSLNNHMKTAKYCLGKRGIKKDRFNCSKCTKTFSSKRWCDSHINKCGESIEKLKTRVMFFEHKISDLEDQLLEKNKHIEKLEDKLENIAIKAVQRPTTTNNMNKTMVNNFIQNMKPVTTANLLEHADKLTLEHVQKGASGYAEYALEYPLKNRVACVDYGRRKIKFKDSEGKVITDPEMLKLAPMFFESIKAKSSELVYSLNNADMDSAMFEEVAKLFNMNADVKNGSSGVKTDFYHDFVKHICSGSVVE